jgi:6-phosphogluconolactonase (cycloisomerase 2 family)
VFARKSARAVFISGVTALTSVALSATAAGASPVPGPPPFEVPPFPSGPSQAGGLVYVNTNNPVANSVAVFAAGRNGSLNYLASYPTGGQGGAEQGAVVDKLASQSSIATSPDGDLAFAVNAGSDSLSVFAIRGGGLVLSQVLPTNGEFPTSVAASGNLVYVLNAGGAGSLSGYSEWGGQLHPVPGSTISLGLANTDPPNFLQSPGEVIFSPDGTELFVTTKTSGSDILAYHVDPDGRLWAAPVVNPAATPAPFSLVFAGPGELVSAEAGTSTLSTYFADSDGQLSVQSSLSDNQAALCWVARAGNYIYVANAGSADISGYVLGPDGQLSLIGTTGVVGTTGAGDIDLTVVPGDHLLYVESGGTGTVDGFTINPDGTLTSAGSTVVPNGADLEGIASI